MPETITLTSAVPWTPLSLADMERATLALYEDRARFGDERLSYVGASEAGDCPHRVAHRKVFPEAHEITDPSSAGRMLRGSALENTLVQIVRLSPLGKWIRDTGAHQSEIIVPDAPIRVHPDGTILRLPIPDGQTHALVLDPSGALVEIEVASLQGPGVLELKSLGTGAFASMKKKGLVQGYVDQVQIQMGATGRLWAILVAGQSDDPSKVLIFLLRFDPERWEFLKAKARAIMAAVEKAILSGSLDDLPEPDRTCGHCDYCPLNGTCRAFAVADADPTATFAPEEALEAEVLGQEYLELSPMAKRLKDVKEALHDLFAAHPVETHVSPEGIKLARAWTAARETCDISALKIQFPEAYNATVTAGTKSMWVRVSAPKAPKGTK